MELNSESRILVVAAHPDDEVLGCGGTIAHATALGAKVAALYLGEGVSARFPLGSYDSSEFEAQSRVRTEGTIKAQKLLGIDEYWLGTRLCCQFDQYPFLGITKEIEAALDRFRPSILLTHDPSEVNIDHRLTFQAVEAACRPARAVVPDAIYTFEIICSGGWTFDTSFKPNVYVDITRVMQKKIEAMACYFGEERPFPFPRSSTGLEALARYRGMAAGVELAEGFRLVRQTVRL